MVSLVISVLFEYSSAREKPCLVCEAMQDYKSFASVIQTEAGDRITLTGFLNRFGSFLETVLTISELRVHLSDLLLW